MPVVPSVGALLAGIGPDFVAILMLLMAIRPAILPFLDTFSARGARDPGPGGEKRRNKDQAEMFHPFGFQ
jgi:hypothetical protein